MADLVVRAILKDNVVPELAKMAAAVQAIEKQMSASQSRMHQNTQRHANRTNTEIFKIDNAMRGTARRMASRVLLIGGAIAAAAGHAVALTAALWPMIGALGAIPAVTVGGIASIAALVTGFAGLGAAMKKTGGGSASSANQITAAQRRIEMANRSLRNSQEALNDAWEEARDRLRDIQTQYAGAQLDVEAAALAVRDAELALREARSSGDRMERARADLALRQARLNEIEAINRLSDVEQEYNERLAKGVEGSDEVRDATERHADALHELEEAQKALNEALKGGGGGGGDNAYAKLAPAAKELVDTLRRLAPAWREVRTETQQRLFAGVAGDVEKLSGSYLPVMERQLPALAQGWNDMFRGVAGVASRADRIWDIDISLGLMADMWQRVGGAFGKFFDGFIDWVRVGSDFLPRLGNWVDEHAERWRRWSERVRETGEAHRWIENALVTGHKFNELIKIWGRSLFEVFRLGQDATLLDRLIAGSQAFERWLSTAEGQERITQMWERMREIGSAAWEVIKEILDILSQFDASPIADVLGVVAHVLGVMADNMSVLNPLLEVAIPLFVGLKVAKTAGAAIMSVADGAGAAITSVRNLAARVGPLTVAMGGLAGAAASVAGFVLYQQTMEENAKKTERMAQAIDTFMKTGLATGEMAREFGTGAEAVENFRRKAESAREALDRFWGLGERLGARGISWLPQPDDVRDFERIDAALADSVITTEDAARAVQWLRDAYGEANVEYAFANDLLPQLKTKIGDVKEASEAEAAAVDGATQAWRDAANALDTYMDALQRHTDPIFRFMKAQENVAEKQAIVNQLITEGKEGTPEYEAALLDLTEATLDMRSAMADAAAVDTNILIPALQDLVEQGILTQQQADQIANAYKRVQDQAKNMQGMRTQIYLDVIANTTELQKAMSGYYAQRGAFLAAGYRAKGGPVKAGAPYVVGEEGPELFVPGQSGTIVPNKATASGAPVGAHKVELTINLVGADAEMKRWFKRAIRVNGAKAFGLQPA